MMTDLIFAERYRDKHNIYIYIFLSSYPYEIAPARHSPIAADLPLPLPAVSDTVERSVCSEMASRKDNTAFA